MKIVWALGIVGICSGLILLQDRYSVPHPFESSEETREVLPGIEILFEKVEALVGVATAVMIDQGGVMELTFTNTTSSPISLEFAVEETFKGLRNVVHAQVRRPSGEIAFAHTRPSTNDGEIPLFHIAGRAFFEEPLEVILKPGVSYLKEVDLKAELARMRLDTIQGAQVRFKILPNFLRKDWWTVYEMAELDPLPRSSGGVVQYPGAIQTDWIDMSEWER